MVRPASHERDIQDWPLANGEVLRLRLLNHKGREYCDLRRWYTDPAGELKPSPRGIRFNSELVGPLVEVLTKIEEGYEVGARQPVAQEVGV